MTIPPQSKEFVVGIHIGAEHVSCSLALESIPFKIFHINNWDNTEIQEQSLFNSAGTTSVYPTSVKYILKSDDFICGPNVLSNEHSFDELINIHNLISDHLGGNSELFENYGHLTTIKILSAFFTKMLEVADQIFDKMLADERDHYLTLHEFEITKNTREEGKCTEIINNIREKFTYRRELCRYCISGPANDEYRDLLRAGFDQAGIIPKENTKELLFVSNAESFGYYLNSLNDHRNKFTDGSKYIICDLSYDYVNFAVATVDATESKSTVQAGDTINIPDMKQWRPLETSYRHFLKMNGERHVQEQVVSFRNEIRKPSFEFNGEPLELFLRTFMKPIIDALSFLQDRNNKIKMVYYLGDLSKHPQINDILQSFDAASGNLITRNPHIANDVISKGAVTHALVLEDVTLPKMVKDVSFTAKILEDDVQVRPVGKDYDLIIGIDFGTTYSGVSYAKPGTNSIYTIEEWPLSDKLPKAPTLLLYNTKKKRLEDNWGGKARSIYDPKKTTILECFKLLLSPEALRNYYGPRNSDVNKYIKENSFKSLDITEMIAHYLQRLIKTAFVKIRKAMTELTKKSRIKYILTVPCMWTEAAKTTMLDAAVKAKLANDKDDIITITEPEAAALYFYDEIKNLRLESYFIVCDAGGGTVDLVTYAATTTKEGTAIEDNNSSERSIQQVGDGCGDTCGSNQINLEFERYLAKCFPDKFTKRKEFLAHVVGEFENIKRSYNGIEERIPISLPSVVRNVRDFRPAPGTCVIRGGYLYIPGTKIKEIFDVMINRTIDLLERELGQTKAIGRVESVILIGGFSKSPYLRAQVQKWCDSKGIDLAGERNLMTAVSDGAVSYGLSPRLVTRRTAGQSYALLIERETGIRTLDHFIWKNERIDSMHQFVKKITLDGLKNMVIAIFSYDAERNENKTNSLVYYKDTYSKVLEVRIDKRHCHKTAFVKLQFTPIGVECYVFKDATVDDFSYGAAVDQKAYRYKLRNPGVRGDIDAIKALDNFKYRPLSTQYV